MTDQISGNFRIKTMKRSGVNKKEVSNQFLRPTFLYDYQKYSWMILPGKYGFVSAPTMVNCEKSENRYRIFIANGRSGTGNNSFLSLEGMK
jgi:hypothetical protein